MGLGHNNSWVESHMWPQQMWDQRSSRGQWLLVEVFEKKVTVSTYFDVFSWDPRTQRSLGRVAHVTSTDLGQRSSRSQLPLVQVFKKGSLYPHTLIYFHGTWIQWSLGRVTHVTSTEVGSKVIMGLLTFSLIFWKIVIVLPWQLDTGLNGLNRPGFNRPVKTG